MTNMQELLMDRQAGNKQIENILGKHDLQAEITDPGFALERPKTISVKSLGGEELQICWIEKFDAEYSRESVIFAQAWNGDDEEILLVWNDADRGWKRVDTNPFLTIQADGETSGNGRDRS